MKSIVYIFFVLTFIGMVMFTIQGCDDQPKQSITIYCTDNNVSLDLLKESGNILKSRLEDYGYKEIEVNIDSSSQSITLLSESNLNKDSLKNLLTIKGSIGFYEVCDRNEIIYNQGKNSMLDSLMIIPGDSGVIERYSGILGYCSESQKPTVENFLKKYSTSAPYKEINFSWSDQPDENGNYNLFVLKNVPVIDNSFISEADIKKDAQGISPMLMIKFNAQGADIWENVTKENIGRSIVISIDNKVIVSPKVMDTISGGTCIMTGNFTNAEIIWMRSMLNNSALPLNFKI